MVRARAGCYTAVADEGALADLAGSTRFGHGCVRVEGDEAGIYGLFGWIGWLSSKGWDGIGDYCILWTEKVFK